MRARYKSVILSGLPKSGKSTLADLIAAECGWERHSVGGLWRARWKREYPNGVPTFEEYWRTASKADNIQVNLDAAEIAKKGNVVIDTRYPVGYDNASLKIHLTATLDVRAERSKSSYPGLSHEEIKRVLMQREDDEVRVGRDLFGIDYREPKHYFVTFSTDNLKPEEIMEYLRHPLGLGPKSGGHTTRAK